MTNLRQTRHKAKAAEVWSLRLLIHAVALAGGKPTRADPVWGRNLAGGENDSEWVKEGEGEVVIKIINGRQWE